MDEDIGLFQLDPQLLGIGHEIGREIAAIKLHALDGLEFGLEALGFLDRDHAFIADLVHGFGKDTADLLIAIGRNGRDLRDLAVRHDLLGVRFQIGDHGPDRQVDAALEVHRVHARTDGLGALAHDGLGQHRGGGGAVAGLVILLAGNLAQHLRAHVLELVLELDFLGDGHAVLGDARRAEALFDHHIAPLGAEGYLDRIGQNIDAAQHPGASVFCEHYFLGSHDGLPPFSRFRLNKWK